MKKALTLPALAFACTLSLAACGPAVTTPTAPAPTAPAPADGLRYSVTPGAPVAVSVSVGDAVTVSRSAGVSSVQIRWSANPAAAYLLSDQNPAMTFKASAGLVGEYYRPERCTAEPSTCWAVFLKVDKP